MGEIRVGKPILRPETRQSLWLLALSPLFLLGLILLWNWVLRPSTPDTFPAVDPTVAAAAQAHRDVSFDPQNVPVIWRDVSYEYDSARLPDWYPKKQSPVSLDLEQNGLLPPLAERVGLEPLVLEGVEGIGQYGGTWLRVVPDVGDIGGTIVNRLSGVTLTRWSPLGYPVVPHLAKRWETSDDYRVWTFYLRKGMCWSDGVPFTADDILYYFEEDYPYYSAHAPDFLRCGDGWGRVEKVGDHAIRFTFPHPYPSLAERLTWVGSMASTPRHYLRPFHPVYGDPKLIAETCRLTRMANARALYGYIKSWTNPEHPRLWPWILRRYTPSPPYSFVRNPYYWVVDTSGQQLPYLDRLTFEVKSANLIPVSAANGRISLQSRHIRFEDYTLLMSERERGEYDVYHWFQASRSIWTLWPNLNKYVPPGDGEAEWKHHFLNQADFRRALSLAIDRQRIIRTEYAGVGQPAQIAPGPESRFYSPELMQSYITYDPETANRMLDDLGLEQRDGEGMRTFPDGQRMTFFIDFTDYTGRGPAEFVVDDWCSVGIRTIYRERARRLFQVEKNNRSHDFMVWMGESEFFPQLESRSFVPVRSGVHGIQADGFGRWFELGGVYGRAPSSAYGVVEPPPDHPLRQAMNHLENINTSADLAQQEELFDRIFKISAENVWSISISTPPPQLAVVKNGFRNVPRNVMNGVVLQTPANAGLECFFWDKPETSPGFIRQVREEMLETSGSLLRGGQRQPGAWLGVILRWLIGLAVVLSLFLLGWRHPYIGRRMVVMVPTLLIISVVVFALIQLPPSDFIEARIMELRMAGEDSAIEEITQLREIFHLDESWLARYSRWMGFHWFFSFSTSDMGLLQGSLGLSMENLRPVNEIVGDRIMLTIIVSLATILFVWLTAIPIGIYTAVRQYSIGDYLISFIGFIGMCIPSFLLALLLMHWCGKYLDLDLTGLFSAKYALQPEWTWGKVVDLCKHLWVPIVILGIGGTAGMIRVMRANLLDELSKPYVVTARAKGMRPLRLLIKYPVRMALNPFVSGIGQLFPQLISGGAIVAIVLSLPMVGPMLLSALMLEDFYLAGSMLMVLSLLGVVGTLCSDLLLLWLDPRIRLESGS